MKAEKEFRAEDGSSYRIIMKLSTFSSDSYGRWSIDVYKKEKIDVYGIKWNVKNVILIL